MTMSVLEFIAALKWPIVVLVVLGWTSTTMKRHPGFGRRIAAYLDKRDVRGKAGPVEFEATTPPEAPPAVEQAAAFSATTDDELGVALTSAEGLEEGQYPEPVTPLDLPNLRREVVEELLRTSTQWGWEMARMGFQTPPDPQVEWTDDGRPQIMYGQGTLISRSVVVPPSPRLTPFELGRRASKEKYLRGEQAAARAERLRRDAEERD